MHWELFKYNEYIEQAAVDSGIHSDPRNGFWVLEMIYPITDDPAKIVQDRITSDRDYGEETTIHDYRLGLAYITSTRKPDLVVGELECFAQLEPVRNELPTFRSKQ